MSLVDYEPILFILFKMTDTTELYIMTLTLIVGHMKDLEKTKTSSSRISPSS